MWHSICRPQNCCRSVVCGFPLLFVMVCCFFINRTKYHEDIISAKISNNELKFSDNIISRLEGPLMGDDPLVIANLKKKFLAPPSTLPYNFSKANAQTRRNRRFLESTIYYIFAKRIFSNKTNGFFIEAGALDGEGASNTLWLEVTQNWTGLLIEPYSLNCQSLKEKQRKSWTSCTCITPKPYAETTVLEIPKEIDYHISHDLLYRSNARSVHSRFHTFDDMIQQTSWFSYSTVQCFPLISYLIALNVTVVDLLSLDTQGGEKTVLLNFPYDKIKVKYIFVEYYKKGVEPQTFDKDFEKEMALRNFKLVEMANGIGDYIFMNTQ